MSHPSSPESAEHSQRITQALRISDVPRDFAMPGREESLIISDREVPDNPESAAALEKEGLHQGFEVISVAEANSRYGKDFGFGSDIQAMILRLGEKPDFSAQKGFKGLRANEVVTSQKIAERFGIETSFSVALTDKGEVMVENTKPDETLSVMRLTPPKDELPESLMETRPRPVKAEVVQEDSAVELEKSAEEPNEEIVDEMADAAFSETGPDEPISEDLDLSEAVAHTENIMQEEAPQVAERGEENEAAETEVKRRLDGLEDTLDTLIAEHQARIDRTVQELDPLFVGGVPVLEALQRRRAQLSHLTNEVESGYGGAGTLKEIVESLRTMAEELDTVPTYIAETQYALNPLRQSSIEVGHDVTEVLPYDLNKLRGEYFAHVDETLDPEKALAAKDAITPDYVKLMHKIDNMAEQRLLPVMSSRLETAEHALKVGEVRIGSIRNIMYSLPETISRQGVNSEDLRRLDNDLLFLENALLELQEFWQRLKAIPRPQSETN